jgi:hypothetical protein
MKRRLAAIFIPDVVNYTNVLKEDIENTATGSIQAPNQIIEPFIFVYNS